MKHKRVFLPMYDDWTLDIFIGPHKKVEKYLLETTGHEEDLSGCNGGTWSYLDKEGSVNLCVYVENQRNYPTIAHEALHILYSMSHYTNCEINKDSQEWQACFIEWLVRTIIEL